MKRTILVFGLPGAGKTTFASQLKVKFGIDAIHINGDNIRRQFDDWDFSTEGRRRQLDRMIAAANEAKKMGYHAILDFICPLKEFREIIQADIVVYADRTPVRNFEDTSAIFEKPEFYDYRIIDSTDISQMIDDLYLNIKDEEFQHSKPTGLMIGRFQPFHDGHKALFEKALEKHGQVCIAVRDMPRDEKNPYDAITVVENIRKKLIEHAGKFLVVVAPNIVDVVYGRDVGWTVSKIDLPPEIEAISATKIRAEMNSDG
jgi:cytidyltransferase-like protein